MGFVGQGEGRVRSTHWQGGPLNAAGNGRSGKKPISLLRPLILESYDNDIVPRGVHFAKLDSDGSKGMQLTWNTPAKKIRVQQESEVSPNWNAFLVQAREKFQARPQRTSAHEDQN